jgi:hypothetical protein
VNRGWFLWHSWSFFSGSRVPSDSGVAEFGSAVVSSDAQAVTQMAVIVWVVVIRFERALVEAGNFDNVLSLSLFRAWRLSL